MSTIVERTKTKNGEMKGNYLYMDKEVPDKHLCRSVPDANIWNFKKRKITGTLVMVLNGRKMHRYGTNQCL